MHLSSCCYLSVRMLLYMCPFCDLYVSAYCCSCALTLLFLYARVSCHETSLAELVSMCLWLRTELLLCVLVPNLTMQTTAMCSRTTASLYMCPHTAIYSFSGHSLYLSQFPYCYLYFHIWPHSFALTSLRCSSCSRPLAKRSASSSRLWKSSVVLASLRPPTLVAEGHIH